LFTDISRLLGGEDRVAAQVVTGIGFLGAGVIFREGAGVKGITTAATVWAAAAVGMAIGAELYVAGVLGAVLIFGLLWSRPITRGIEQAIRPREQALRQTVEEAVAPEEEETRSDD
jgi:putative Mg2+ transporter-C (MgtC) family protein